MWWSTPASPGLRRWPISTPSCVRARTSRSSAGSSATPSTRSGTTRSTSSTTPTLAYIIGEKYGFDDGLFSGFDEGKATYDKASWAYEADPKTHAYAVDPTLQHSRCVFQLLKKHVERYTPETVERITGTPKDSFLKVAEVVTSTFTPERVGTITYALGWTQHSVGVQMIRTAAMLQLLLGNVGRPGGGVNALRGHSNIQGATDLGGTFEILSGYLATPRSELVDLKTYLDKVTPKTLNNEPWHSMNYWSNYPKFTVSLLKAFYGKAATNENDFAYSWLPKTDGNYSWLYLFDDMYRRQVDPGRRRGARPGGAHHRWNESSRHRAE